MSIKGRPKNSVPGIKERALELLFFHTLLAEVHHADSRSQFDLLLRGLTEREVREIAEFLFLQERVV